MKPTRYPQRIDKPAPKRERCVVEKPKRRKKEPIDKIIDKQIEYDRQVSFLSVLLPLEGKPFR